MQALDQLLELSTVAESKGVTLASLEERLVILQEAVNVADALAPPQEKTKAAAAKKAAEAAAAAEAAPPPRRRRRSRRRPRGGES